MTIYSRNSGDSNSTKQNQKKSSDQYIPRRPQRKPRRPRTRSHCRSRARGRGRQREQRNRSPWRRASRWTSSAARREDWNGNSFPILSPRPWWSQQSSTTMIELQTMKKKKRRAFFESGPANLRKPRWASRERARILEFGLARVRVSDWECELGNFGGSEISICE